MWTLEGTWIVFPRSWAFLEDSGKSVSGNMGPCSLHPMLLLESLETCTDRALGWLLCTKGHSNSGGDSAVLQRDGRTAIAVPLPR